MKRAAIGVSAHMGWVLTATVSPLPRRSRGDAPQIEVVRTDRLETARPGDREAAEPYHVAGGWDQLDRVPTPRNPEAAVARGLGKQRAHALESFRRLSKELANSGYRLTDGAILCGRGRLAATLPKILASHAQIHVAEGLAVRDSAARALAELNARVTEIDQKDLFDTAAEALGLSERALADALAQLRPARGPWRQEEKKAAVAAWLALA